MRGLKRGLAVASLGLAALLYAGDGSDEPGYVPAPIDSRQIPPPPANMSGGESFIPYPPPPAASMSRSEKKNPPKPPTMFTKLTDGEYDSNARPDDLNGLCKELKRLADVDYDWELKTLNEFSSDPDENPILVFTKYNRWSLNDDQRKKMRDFALRGGTIIFNPGGGSAPAYNSAVAEAVKILPEASNQMIGSDHPMLNAFYPLKEVKVNLGKNGVKTIEPQVNVSTVSCRAAIIIPQYGVVDSFSGEYRPDLDNSLLPEDSQKLGMNILAYASAERKWQEGLKREAVLQDKVDGLVGKLHVAQVVYNGEWKTRDAALKKELAYFNQASDVPVKFAQRELRLTDKSLFDSPVIFMTGHEPFSLSDAEKKNLRDYLQSGGSMFIESCCGRKSFDESARRMINGLFPGETLIPVSVGSAIYRVPNKIEQMRVTPALEHSLKSQTMSPNLLRLNHEGKDVIIYSPIGLQTGWELSPDCFSNSYLSEDAIKLGVNIFTSLMTK